MKVTIESAPLLEMIENHLASNGVNMDGMDFLVKFKGGRVNPPFAEVNVFKTDGEVPQAVVDALQTPEKEEEEYMDEDEGQNEANLLAEVANEEEEDDLFDT